MTPDDRQFLKQAYQALADEPLEPDDPRCVALDAARGGKDLVELLSRTIELSGRESMQLFSGFPGTGKTTELRRLRSRLIGEGYKVVFIDMDRRLEMSKPLATRELLICLAQAVNDEMVVPEHLDEDMNGAVALRIGLVLRTAVGGTNALAHGVSEFFNDCVKRLRVRHGPATELVLLVDSVEHIRGSFTGARSAQDSIESVFTGDIDKFRFSNVHVVYTAPPHVKARLPSAAHGISTIPSLPAVYAQEIDGTVHLDGLSMLHDVAERRVDLARLFGDDAEKLKSIILASGGNLRDLLRLLREIVRRARELPVSANIIDEALGHIGAEFRPLLDQDILPLARVAHTHDLALDRPDALYDLSRWADAHLLLSYRNGKEWYDIHPLIRDAVLCRAAELEQAPPSPAREPEATPASPLTLRAAPAEPVVLTPEMSVTLLVENYRALQKIRWTLPRGVSALVGPNGSGKTTLLDVPELLRHALEIDVRKAVDARGGPGTLRRADAARDAPVILGVALDHIGWQLSLFPRGAAVSPSYEEQAMVDGAITMDRNATGARADDPRPMLRRFAESPDGAAFRPLIALLEGYRLYGTYDLTSIRVNGSQVSSDEHLHPDGRNIFSLLRNWRDRSETKPRWEFVLESLREGFPDIFANLDFDMAGQTVAGRIVTPRPDVRVPTYFAANGWLIALLHLAAVASTEPAGIVAIDEVENGLHPYAIRALLEAMRRWADKTGISIVLATHSPVVLDQFKDAPDHLFVMEPGRETAPVSLDELHDPNWLAHFSLGDLYAHDEFGAQTTLPLPSVVGRSRRLESTPPLSQPRRRRPG